ncbi:sugar phosphate isomerase/epimerase family protein [Pedosphaera parvula]|uniref:Xylose isomerase domain protein TIM barrel n=1 Tax=Pedosphaera parvula (strain Ellin514) TaxID=320771 RepID=B9XT48_PEDPL|nr:sugar phosphate isomerase/epimerase family protein [Pedosphaera parvula]EEF56983.1 Xylose isomerase domain protein TIM barrel [Pedosphaera parvula Ellin514]
MINDQEVANGADGKAVSPKKRELKKGYFLNTFPGKFSLLEKFKMLKEAGFEGVEAPSHLDQEEVLKACEETGLKLPTVSCGAHSRMLSSGNPEQRKKGLDGVMQALHDAKRYGASSILVVPGTVDERMTYADAYTRTQDELRKAIPLAEELGVKMGFENTWNHFLLSPMESARYVDEFKSSAAAWHFDVGNIIGFGYPEQWIRILGKRIQKLHIKEYSRKKQDAVGVRKAWAVEYLEGDNDWPTVMKALDEIGYSGWAVAEPAWRPEGVSVEKRLKTIVEKMEKILAC